MISIRLMAFEASAFAISKLGKILARASAERLLAFRRIDADEADFVLVMVFIEDGDRIAVVDAHYTAS